jgi:predicted nucleic acid-binding protein
VKALFDTSVLVGALTTGHPRHSACLPYVQKVRNREIEGYFCTHDIAELYSVLTGRTNPRILPADVRLIMSTDLAMFQVIDLDSSDYLSVMDQLVTLGLSGGIFFDALHAFATSKAGKNAESSGPA